MSKTSLNEQLTTRDAVKITTTTTAAKHRFYALAGRAPFRPELVRNVANGATIEVEVWRMPT